VVVVEVLRVIMYAECMRRAAKQCRRWQGRKRYEKAATITTTITQSEEGTNIYTSRDGNRLIQQ